MDATPRRDQSCRVIHCYETRHTRNETICRAFAQGCRGKVVPPAPLRPGAVFMYGCLRGLKPTLDQAVAEGRTWYYADNGYFRQGRGKQIHVGYFRVTRNAIVHDGSGQAQPERWRRLGLEIKPWRETGSHVVVCPPDLRYGELWGLDHEAWLKETLKRLKSATDRPIHVRLREVRSDPLKPFAEAIRDAWCLVTHHSNAAVEAALAGVPVICTGPCGATSISTTEIERVEDPPMPDDRERWAAVLAASQWRLDEMRSGECWQQLVH